MLSIEKNNFLNQYEDIIRFISKKYNIDLNELKQNIDKISKNTINNTNKIIHNTNDIINDSTKININECINYDINRCKAYVIKPKEKEKNQCTRQHKIDGFCNLHYNLHNELKLKYGFINIVKKTEIIENKNINNTIKVINEKKTPSVQRILLEGIEYKINPLTSFVYDFHSNAYLGKLDSNYNFIKDYQN